MKKGLLSILVLLTFFTFGCKSKDSVNNQINQEPAKLVTVTGSLSVAKSKATTITAAVSGYRYILAVPIGGGESKKAEITNNSFSLAIDSSVKYVFYFLNEYGIKVNEMEFSGGGIAANITESLSLGTLTPSLEGKMEVSEEVKVSAQTKTELGDTFNPTAIVAELKETIGQILVSTGQGTIVGNEVRITTTTATTTDTIKIQLGDSSGENLIFNKIDVVRETTSLNGDVFREEIPIPISATGFVDNINAVTAILGEIQIALKTEGEIGAVLETKINNIPLSGIDTVSAINPVVTKFTEEQQTKFTQYYETLKAKYATYYGEFASIIDGNNLKITAKCIESHTEGTVGDALVIEITKADLYNYLYTGSVITPSISFDITKLPVKTFTAVAEQKVWNITKADLNVSPTSISQTYSIMSGLKAKSNSPAMNYLFQAILDTQPLESALREQIVNGLNGYVPVGQDYRTYEYAKYVFDTPSEIYDVVTNTGLVALDKIAENLEKAYLLNETVTLDKTNLTDGYTVVVTPTHFKAMSGAFKVYLAQLTLLSSYKFTNDADFNEFAEFVNGMSNEGLIDVAFLRDRFKDLDVLNVNPTLQAKALKYMQEGMAELVSASKEMPVRNPEIALKNQNILTIDSTDKTTIITEIGKVNSLLTGAYVGVEDSVGKTIWVKVNMTKLYSLDIKAIVAELVSGTEGKTDAEIKAQLTANINNSTFGGILPNKLPTALQVK